MVAPPTRLNPYVGPRAFQAGERLYGRTRELDDLRDLLVAERLVLLYSPSGAGKSSLIQAALIPELVQRRFRVRPVVRVNTPPPEGVPAEANRYTLSVLLSLDQDRSSAMQLPPAELARLNLATYLDRRNATDGPADEVLIFDQFEEVLTLDPTDGPAKMRFFSGLRDALRDRRRWALFALREDYLAGLDSYRAILPGGLVTTFRLDLLGQVAALQAIQAPADAAGVDFADVAANRLVDDLRRVQVQRPDGTADKQMGPYVEPVQLQVVCRGLWDQLPPGATTISEANVTEAGDVDTALEIYYATSVASVASIGVPERRIRDWCEEQLITASGIRGQVLRGTEASGDLDNRAIAGLVDAHLVRAEGRRGATWYELAHDRLIEPLRADNARWREEHLQSWQRQARLWAERERAHGLLVRGADLRRAVRWAGANQDELTVTEEEFLARSVEAQRQQRRILGIAAGALGIFLLLFVATTFEAINANASAVTAIHAQATAEAQARVAHTQAALALASDAELQLAQNQDLSVLLAMQAISATRQYGEPVVPQAENMLHHALAGPGARPILSNHLGSMTIAAWSPDGTHILTAGGDGTARVWDGFSGQLRFTLTGHTGPLDSAAWSPDGTRILTAGGGTAAVWDAATGLLRFTLPGHTNLENGNLRTAIWSPNGMRILTSGGGYSWVWDGANGQLRATLHEGFVTAAWSPDSNSIVTSVYNGTMRLWDAATGQEEAGDNLDGHTSQVNSLTWSADGTRILSASFDGTARIWNAKSGQLLFTFTGHTKGLYRATWSADGTRVLSVSWDQTARVWDAATGHIYVTLIGHTGPVYTAMWSPDGTLIVTAGDDGTARIWDAVSGQPRAVLRGHTGPVTSATWSLDGTRIITTSDDGTVRVWNAATGQIRTTLTSPINLVVGLYRSDNGALLDLGTSPDLTIYSDPRIKDWDGTSGDIPALTSHTDWVTSAVWSPDGTSIVTASADQTARIWDAASSQSRATLTGHTGSVYNAAWSPDGTHIVTASADRTARIWDAPSGQLHAILTGHADLVTSAAWSPDGKSIITSSTDQTARIWDAVSGQSRATLTGHTGPVYYAAWSPNGKSIVTTSVDQTARIWDAASGQIRATLTGHTGPVYNAAWSPDGKSIVTVSADQTARLWDAATGRLRATLTGHAGLVTSAAWSPDGKTIVTAGSDSTARLWYAATGQLRATLTGHIGSIASAAWSPDGKTIATAGSDGTARVWDAASGQLRATLVGHAGSVYSVVWSPDGRRILTASADGTARQWVITIPDLLAVAQTRVPRGLSPEERATYLGEPLPTPLPIPSISVTPSPVSTASVAP